MTWTLWSLHSVAFWEELQYPFVHDCKPNTISDIQDGALYNELQKPGKFLSYPEHTGLMLNTDGVAVFGSAKHSIWPIYLSLVSLSPHLRMRKDFIMLAGVWFGMGGDYCQKCITCERAQFCTRGYWIQLLEGSRFDWRVVVLTGG